MLALIVSLLVWGDEYASSDVLEIVGDNTGSLQDALSLKGSGALNTLSMELSWRKAQHGWAFTVGHLPSEANTMADALSRLAEEGYEFPTALASCTCREPPSLDGFFQTLQWLPSLALED